MIFRFVHSADWHIGKPFGRFPEHQASLLRRARLNAVDRLAAVARQASASAILVAGDIYDGPGLADRDLLELMGRIAPHTAIAWYLIPGNHDPATAGGLWDRLARLGMPPNVHLLRTPAPVDIAPGVVLLPAPLTAKATTADPTAWMSAAATPEGVTRIGLAHGSTHGFGSEMSASVNIAPTRARDSGLAYLALGDWHGTREIAPSTWYAGTPEPDSFQDNDPGNALLVTIAASGAPAIVERHRTAEMTWLSRRLDVRTAADLAPLLQEIADPAIMPANLLLDLILAGEIPPAEDALIREKVERQLDPRLLHLRTSFDALTLAPGEGHAGLLSDPLLQTIAAELAAAARAASPDAAIATEALRRLYQAARAEETAA